MATRLLIVAALAALLVGCASRANPPTTDFVTAQLQALDKLPAPDGVARAEWLKLKEALRSSILENAPRRTSAVPDSAASKAGLAFDGAQLSWGFYSAGDYDQNGEV